MSSKLQIMFWYATVNAFLNSNGWKAFQFEELTESIEKNNQETGYKNLEATKLGKLTHEVTKLTFSALVQTNLHTPPSN